MSVLLVALPGNEARTARLAARLSAEVATAEFRRFPDGETYVRIDTPASGRTVVVVASLDRPDEKLPAVLFAASAARECGARRVVLTAPYLAYMRQDARFRPGEAVTAGVVARWLSAAFDAIVAVDPHLHRVGSLGELYRVPTVAVSAASAVADHLRASVERPVIVGPDAESGRWVGAVAASLDAPCVVLEKVRRGDRDVLIGGADGAAMWKSRTPVLLDDIVSTGRTMIGAARLLEEAGFAPAVCVGVHAVFAPGAYDELRRAHVARVVTCDTIEHPSNGISLDELLARGVEDALARIA
jgi:ribose-phosphate pyrophosphokinase